MTGLPILYSFRRCPYAMRARLGIWSSGLAVELREIVLRDKPQDMLIASPKGTVPVLVLADGAVIEESRDIMVWALTQSDPEAVFAGSDDPLIDECDGPFKAALDRYKYPEKYDGGMDDREYQREIGADFLRELDFHIEGKSGLGGDRLTFVDYAILPFVRQYAHVDLEWFMTRDWPHLIRWLEAFKGSPRFDAIMQKHAPWKPGDTAVIFGRGVKAD